jgi:hypothetical protein
MGTAEHAAGPDSNPRAANVNQQWSRSENTRHLPAVWPTSTPPQPSLVGPTKIHSTSQVHLVILVMHHHLPVAWLLNVPPQLLHRQVWLTLARRPLLAVVPAAAVAAPPPLVAPPATASQV